MWRSIEDYAVQADAANGMGGSPAVLIVALETPAARRLSGTLQQIPP
jgi:hypothetical protein